jgi:LDH2 family malate/lactate/ureidoglycolate dehydrogenase
MGKAIDDIKSVKKASGVERIYVLGERSPLMRQERRRNGIPVSSSVFQVLCQVGARYGVRMEGVVG